MAKNPGLLKLIEAQREGHWRPTPDELRRGFRGWHERGYLRHFDAPHVTQLVSFMLDDFFPVSRRAEWEPYLKEPDLSLRRPAIADAVMSVLRASDGTDYRLRA